MRAVFLFVCIFLGFEAKAQVPLLAVHDCIECEEGLASFQIQPVSTAHPMIPSPELVEELCTRYRGTALVSLDIMLRRHGWSIDEYFDNYGEFICLRNSLPITHHVTHSGGLALDMIERDLLALENMEDGFRFLLVNRIFRVPRVQPQVYQTQLDQIDVSISRLGSDEHARRVYGGVRDRFIAMGAKRWDELSDHDKVRLGVGSH